MNKQNKIETDSQIQGINWWLPEVGNWSGGMGKTGEGD